MKRFFISIITTVLGLLLAVGIRVGVTTLVENGFAIGSIKKLSGTYMTDDTLTTQDAEDILVRNDFYPEEIALVDLNALYIPKYVEFHTDKTYTFYYDADAYRRNVENFLRQAFDSMYDGRAVLSSSYGIDFTSMSKADFQAYYASIYSENTFDDLITTLTNNCWDYDALARDVEVGTYTVNDNKIIHSINGSSTKTSLTYKLSGNTLTLTYSNGVEVYTKVG